MLVNIIFITIISLHLAYDAQAFSKLKAFEPKLTLETRLFDVTAFFPVCLPF